MNTLVYMYDVQLMLVRRVIIRQVQPEGCDVQEFIDVESVDVVMFILIMLITKGTLVQMCKRSRRNFGSQASV